MANSDQFSEQDFCQKCGQQSSKRTSRCPACGKRKGNDNSNTIVIVIAAIGAFGFFAVILIGILAAIALPNFIGAQQKAKAAAVKGNMHTVQLAAECYATDFKGNYPRSVDQTFESYFPGGNPPNTPGHAPINPFTQVPEWPVLGHVKDVSAARRETPELIGIGVVEYSVILDGKQQPTSYTVRGGGIKGLTIARPTGEPLVLSNQ